MQGYFSATRGTFKPKTPTKFPLDDRKLLQFGDLERPKMGKKTNLLQFCQQRDYTEAKYEEKQNEKYPFILGGTAC